MEEHDRRAPLIDASDVVENAAHSLEERKVVRHERLLAHKRDGGYEPSRVLAKNGLDGDEMRDTHVLQLIRRHHPNVRAVRKAPEDLVDVIRREPESCVRLR